MEGLNIEQVADFLINPRCEVCVFSAHSILSVDGLVVAYDNRGLLVEEKPEAIIFIPWSAVAYIRHREKIAQ